MKIENIMRAIVCLAMAAMLSVLSVPSFAEDAGAYEYPAVNEETVIMLLPENAIDGFIPVELQYVTLLFPEENVEGLKLILTEAEGWTILVAAATIGEVETDLYYLMLGPIETDGVFYGALQDETAGRIDIHMMHVDPVLDGFAEEDYDLIYTLQESMNLILDQLMEDPRYIAE